MADLNSSEFIQATLASFDSRSKVFLFRRSFPVLIYVNAGERSSETGRLLSAIVRETLSEQDFQVQEFRTEVGSFCQLNLCNSRVPIDENTLREKITTAHAIIHERLTDGPIKGILTVAGSAVVAVVAIGTAVQAIQAHEALTIGSFSIPPSIWVPLLVSKETRDFVGEAVKIFVESKAAKKALKRPKLATDQDLAIRLDQPIAKRIVNKDERISQLEERLREVQEDLDRLKRE